MTITLDGTSGITTPATFTGNVNTGQLAGFRNKIINGAMEISQRGTTFAAANGYTLDRYKYNAVTTTAVVTVTQDTNVPSSNEFQYSSKIAVTTADASSPANKFIGFWQSIEGYNVRDLIGKTFTLSFWVKDSKTGTHCVSFQNGNFDRSYVVEYTVNVANTWEYKTITLTGGLITAGTWNWTNGAGLYVVWALAAGSTFQTSANAWQTGNYIATSNQVNCVDAIGNVFALTGVQLEVGNTATPFEHRFYGTELALCQRYFELVRATTLSGRNLATQANAGCVFAVPKRANVTVTAPYATSYSAVNANNVFTTSGSLTISADSSGDTIATLKLIVTAATSWGLTAGAFYDPTYNGNALCGASAEL